MDKLVPLLAVVVISLCSLTCKQVFKADLYKDPTQPSEQRVTSLLAQMTLDEKLAQVQCIWLQKSNFLDSMAAFQPDSAAIYLKNGIGQIGRPSEGPDGGGGDGRNARQMAEFTNTVQKWVKENTRLGIPVLFHEECLHGHAAKDGTSFPQPIAIASAFNRELTEAIYTVTAREAKVRGTNLALSPVVDIVRDPRWGRTEETFGEDAYLAGEMGLAAVRGFQGRSDTIKGDHLMVTLKHMTGHGQPEGGMNIAPANISERVIREAFLPPFKKCIQEGYAKNVMASYNEIDGVPSHASKWLLQDILRGEWGFDGVVVSDYFAIRELHGRHAVAKDLKEAAKIAMETGVDIELPDPECYLYLKELFTSGELDIKVLDIAVSRILKQKFDIGLFENAMVDPARAETEVGKAANAQLALKAAEESIILLKNDKNIVPINTDKYKTIAVIGPNADAELLGGYSDVPKYFTTILEGIRAKVGDKVNVVYADGGAFTEPGSWYEDEVKRTNKAKERQAIERARQVAVNADLIILAVGGNELTSREGWAEGHLGDRDNLTMVGVQDELVNTMAFTNKPMVTFLLNGRPLNINNVVSKSRAVFEGWYLGQETGAAVANVLFGDVNPSGKLPITIPRNVGQIPAFYNYKPTAHRGYLFTENDGLYAFGYGLSYTTFDISEPVLVKDTISTLETATVKVTVSNTGQRAGQEVVQFYIRDIHSSVTRPIKELKGFEKVALAPGESKEVSFEIGEEALALWDIDMNYTIETGDFEIMVGSSSRDTDLKKTTLTVE